MKFSQLYDLGGVGMQPSPADVQFNFGDMARAFGMFPAYVFPMNFMCSLHTINLVLADVKSPECYNGVTLFI